MRDAYDGEQDLILEWKIFVAVAKIFAFWIVRFFFE